MLPLPGCSTCRIYSALDVTGVAQLSPPVQLLWEREESYVIPLPPPLFGAVVQIARGLVDGVVTGAVLTRSDAYDPS